MTHRDGLSKGLKDSSVVFEMKTPSQMDVAPWCYKVDGMGLGEV